MKRAILLTILLASALAVGQLKVTNVSATGCPLSLSTRVDAGSTIIMAHNNSSKGVLALVAVTDVTGVSGQIIPIISTGDLVLKVNAIGPGEDRGIGWIDSSELAPSPPSPDASAYAEGAVLFVQFEDGSTWGDPQAAKEMIAARPEKLAFLKRLVEVYDAAGEGCIYCRAG